MAKKPGEGIDEMLEQARAGSPRPVEQPEREKRYIYNGDTRFGAAGYALGPNKRGGRRKTSTFNIILALFGFGVAIVFYVNNIIRINQLAFEVSQLQTKYDTIVNTNASLRAEVNRKSAWERIGTIATEELGLKYPKEQPTWFDVDEEKLEKPEAE